MGDGLLIIRLRDTDGKKIYVDPLEKEGIYLYPGELRKEGIRDGQEMAGEELERLRLAYALPRAKKRALGILAVRDQTERQLREKLLKARTDSRSLEDTLDFVLSHGYVDDRRYAGDYLASKRSKKSFRQIQTDLIQKGIPAEILEALFEENPDQEEEDLKQLFDRYVRKFAEFDSRAAHKTYAHFVRKGYAPDLVCRLLNEIKETEMS